MTARQIQSWVAAPLVGALALAGSALVAQAPPTSPRADFVVTNARIRTGDPARVEATAAAVAGGRYVAVGGDADLAGWIGPQTRVYDAAGKRVVPGLTDSHLHFLRGGFRWKYEVRADGVRTLDELLNLVRARTKVVPPGTWIVIGGGWHHTGLKEGRMPTQAELDAIAPNHPVNVQSQYDVTQLNSAGITAVNIDQAKLPPGVRFGRDAKGSFNGQALGMGGMRFLETRLPRPTLADKVAGVRGLMTHLNTLGITSVIEAGGGGVSSEDYQALFELWRQGNATVRIAVRYQTPNHETAKPWIIATPGRMGDEWMRILGLGEHLNSTIGGDADEQTSASLEDFGQSVSGAAEHGLSVHQHTVETAAIAKVLDVMERVNARTPIRDLRFSIVHGEGLTPELLTRMKRMGIGFAGDTRWMIFSKARVNEGYIPDAPPFRTIVDMGIPMTFGSDGLIAGAINPFMWLYSAVTGRNWPGEMVRPNQKLTRQEALDALTRNAAWFSFDEKIKGTISPGLVGDMVVLDRDYFTVPEDTIGDIKPVLTVLGGKVVYEAKTAARTQ